MGRIEDKQLVHLLYGISICIAYLSHRHINKKQIRVDSSIPYITRYMKVIVNKLTSIFKRIDGGENGTNSFLLNYSIFTKKL